MLNSFFNVSLENVNSFRELKDLIEEGDAYISIFGGRIVTFPGINGSLYVDDLALKVRQLVRKNFEFSEEDREQGKFIVSKIDAFYKKTDDQAGFSNQIEKKRNIITTTLVIIRECLSKIQIIWETGDRESFEHYTESQYQIRFGHKPNFRPHWSQTNCPDRWMASK